MLTTNRIVPVLLVQDGLLVKTRRFKSPVYVGDPINAVKIFNEKEVDELVVLDRRAARTREVEFGMVEAIASEAFMPVAYGGGINSVDTATAVIGLGIEKIIVTSAWSENNSLITDLAEVLGTQAVVAGVDYRVGRRSVEVFADRGCRKIRRSLADVCQALETRGAGELMLQSIDRDGLMEGMDIKRIQQISASLSIPVMAVGGAGNASHLADALRSGASAVGAASMFVFHGKHKAVLITYPTRERVAEIMVGGDLGSGLTSSS